MVVESLRGGTGAVERPAWRVSVSIMRIGDSIDFGLDFLYTKTTKLMHVGHAKEH